MIKMHLLIEIMGGDFIECVAKICKMSIVYILGMV